MTAMNLLDTHHYQRRYESSTPHYYDATLESK
jgi:hypothetical protein